MLPLSAGEVTSWQPGSQWLCLKVSACAAQLLVCKCTLTPSALLGWLLRAAFLVISIIFGVEASCMLQTECRRLLQELLHAAALQNSNISAAFKSGSGLSLPLFGLIVSGSDAFDSEYQGTCMPKRVREYVVMWALAEAPCQSGGTPCIFMGMPAGSAWLRGAAENGGSMDSSATTGTQSFSFDVQVFPGHLQCPV